jgi:hypothetical protein
MTATKAATQDTNSLGGSMGQAHDFGPEDSRPNQSNGKSAHSGRIHDSDHRQRRADISAMPPQNRRFRTAPAATSGFPVMRRPPPRQAIPNRVIAAK